jgi:drug/metabolite transporter (DMT)-like permease
MSPPRASAGGSIPLATMWAMGAAVGWASMAVVVRYLEGRVPSWDISFYRALTALLVGVGPMLWQKGRSVAALLPRRDLFSAYLFRGFVIFTAQAMYYHALMHIPLADATVLNATAPIFSVFMATIMLRESVGLDRWLLVLLGFAGVVVIIRPGYESVPFEALLALGSAALFALSAILNKRLVRIESGTSIVYGTNFFVALCGLVVVLGWGVKPSWADLGVVALIGVAGASAQYCLTQSLRQADVSFVSPFEFMRVPLVAFAAWILFDQVPPLIFALGATMIFLSVFLLARRAVRTKPAPMPRPAE